MSHEHWAKLTPELIVTDLEASLRFYCDVLGFQIRFRRDEDRFAYLDRDGAQLMLEETRDGWRTGPMEYPFGRGINLQIEVTNAAELAEKARAAGIAFFRPPKESWYRADTIEHGQYEFLVQDPDGYLLRVSQWLGERPYVEPHVNARDSSNE